jgi:hypothetical protein
MSLLDWMNPIGKALDIADKFVEDKDKKNELVASLNELKEQVYMAELNTQTVPWVDALHKMQRGILSILSLAAGTWMSLEGIDAQNILMAVAPAGAYNIIKGKGR